MTDQATPPIPFRPTDPEFAGFPMPATVPAGLRLELSRAPILEGNEALLGEWMSMLTDRYDECLETLPAERAVFEATFKHREADGSVWMYHFALMGAEGSGLDESHSVDAAHASYARQTKARGWEELEPMFMLTPTHIRDVMEQWGNTGRAD